MGMGLGWMRFGRAGGSCGMRRRGAALAIGLAFAGGTAQAQTYERAFGGLSFNKPVHVGEMPGRPGYFIVIEQHAGSLTLVHRKDGAWTKEGFLKITVNQQGEMGLLGVAFHPRFAENRKYYINYNPSSGGMATVIEERTANESFTRDAGTSRQILRVGQPYNNHNGGAIHFGPKDGFLYIGMGDGGSAYDPQGYGLNRNSLLGKFLRIDVDRQEGGKPYAIPDDNPFANGGGSPEIFAYGIRNPWQWSFDPLTGDLWCGDVGQDAMEEVDIIVKGGNYGWKNAEGYNNNGNGITPPVFAYGRGEGRSITGGRVFRGNASSPFHGHYVMADYESRNLWALKPNGTSRATATKLATPPGKPTAFGTDLQGRLYVTDYSNGAVYLFAGTDWAPAPTSLYPGSRGADLAPGRLIFASPGDQVNPELFAGHQFLHILDSRGAVVARLSGSDSRLPAHLDPGVYFLRSGSDEPVGRLLLGR